MSYQHEPDGPQDAMPDDGPRCTQCGSRDLDPGFLQVPGTRSIGMPTWYSGPAEPGAFGGVKNRAQRREGPIVAYRCEECDHLEFYVVLAR